jgi:hypothetical protein
VRGIEPRTLAIDEPPSRRVRDPGPTIR